ncbi:MAG: LytTR family DNA-binding domain-containing protein [Firmicutes bacterium]|nr:LytTR family DNA-binding domain-containing protein [Bacillota bacterium]
MLNIYICEDNIKQREFMTSFITDHCLFQSLDAHVALSTSSPEDILSHYKNVDEPALFFLDIELNAKINGIELASRIRGMGKKAAIVFITTHSEMTFVTFQYKVEALDFIVKDNAANIKHKIAECIKIALERYTVATDKGKTVKISAEDKVIILDMDDIILIETTPMRHKLRLHTQSRILEYNGELKAMEGQLDERFIRCHKSCIINKNKITVINKRDNTVTMANHSICPVSRAAKKLIYNFGV